MKKIYEKPELEITELFSEDILEGSFEKEPGVDMGDIFG